MNKIMKDSVILVLINKKTGEKKVIKGENIITTAGDTYYAQKACGESPTNNFSQLYLCTAGPTTPAKDDDYSDFTVSGGTNNPKSPESGYPKTNDNDSDNTGAGVGITSWKYAYAITDGPFTSITHWFISKAGASGTDPILNSYKCPSAWDKDASSEAKVFVNHQNLGS